LSDYWCGIDVTSAAECITTWELRLALFTRRGQAVPS
jgi:hypothetical protein